MSRRPVIAITGPDRGGFPAWLFTAWAVRRAGGKPVRITPRRAHRRPDFDGLVVGGGADIEPTRYGQSAPSPRRAKRRLGRGQAVASYIIAPLIYLLRRLFSIPRHVGVDQKRDELELELLAHADDTRTPVLGICRGAQLMNVYAGGTLHQDVAGFYAETPARWTVFPRKEVRLVPGSRLAAALGERVCPVNSLHRQAVDRTAAGVRVTARDWGGVVQAIEHTWRPFWIGVQWHPEYLPQRPEQRRLFAAFVDAAKQRAAPSAVRTPGRSRG